MNMHDLEVMARTVWGEARGECKNGQMAVANVILNRANHPNKWANDVTGVCQQPWQFSCWLDHDAAHKKNKERMMAADLNDKSFREAMIACLEAIDCDVTDGSDHYFADYIEAPSWTKDMTFVKQIGVHKFFKA